MLTKWFGDVELVCLRPEYSFPPFDVSIQARAFATTGEFVYGESRPVVVEFNGRQWFHRSLVTPELSDYLLGDLSRYQRMLVRRVHDYTQVRDLTVAVANIMTSGATCDRLTLADAIQKLGDAYTLALRSVVVANLVVEDIYERYARSVNAYLPSAEANRYLAATISCPAALEAAKVGFFEDTRGTKRIQDVRSGPIAIFAENEPFIPHYLDGQLCECALRADDLARFWALRFIAPITVQMCEEFRYADYSIRTHLKACMEFAGPHLGPNQSPYDYGIEPMLAKLREHHS